MCVYICCYVIYVGYLQDQLATCSQNTQLPTSHTPTGPTPTSAQDSSVVDTQPFGTVIENTKSGENAEQDIHIDDSDITELLELLN